jgi:hypothetical protein
VTVVKPKLTLAKVRVPIGDDKLSFKGEATLPVPFDPPLDPVADGVRLIVRDAADALVVDATIGGGTYDVVSRTGWRLNGAATAWTYRNPGTQPEGITTVGVKTIPSLPGLVRFKVKGKNGAYTVGLLPLHAILILDPPVGATGQCLDATFPAIPPERPSCVVAGGGTVIKCK